MIFNALFFHKFTNILNLLWIFHVYLFKKNISYFLYFFHFIFIQMIIVLLMITKKLKNSNLINEWSFKQKMQFYRTMITSINIVIYLRIFYIAQTFLIDYKIIKSPTDILCSASCSHAPPGIFDFFRIEMPKSIYPSIFQKISKTHSFLHSKSSCSFISFGPSDINFFMTNI